jgi:hypothetical protein
VEVAVFRGPVTTFGLILAAVNSSVQTSMAILFLLFLLRAIFRKEWIAGAIYLAIFTGVSIAGSTMPWLTGAFALLQFGLILFLLFRFGLLSAFAAAFAATALTLYVTTWEFSKWYGTPSLITTLMIALLIGVAYLWALGGRKIALEELLES